MNWTALRKALLTFISPLAVLGCFAYAALVPGLISQILGWGLLILLVVGCIGCLYAAYDDEDY